MNEMSRPAPGLRAGEAVPCRLLLGALLATLDAHLDLPARAALLRLVGRRLAGAMPLPPCDTLAALEARMNEALAASGWGSCRLGVDLVAQRLVITHGAVPMLGPAEDAEGAWTGAVLEGLHTAWLAGQPGADPALQAVLTAAAPGKAVLHYGRGAG